MEYNKTKLNFILLKLAISNKEMAASNKELYDLLLRKKEEKENDEMSLLTSGLEKLYADYEQLQKENKQLKEKIASFRDEVGEYDQILKISGKLQNDYDKVMNEKTKLQNDYDKVVNEKTELQNENKQLKKKIASLKDKADDYDKVMHENAELQAENNTLKETNEKANTNLKEITNAKDQIISYLNEQLKEVRDLNEKMKEDNQMIRLENEELKEKLEDGVIVAAEEGQQRAQSDHPGQPEKKAEDQAQKFPGTCELDEEIVKLLESPTLYFARRDALIKKNLGEEHKSKVEFGNYMFYLANGRKYLEIFNEGVGSSIVLEVNPPHNLWVEMAIPNNHIKFCPPPELILDEYLEFVLRIDNSWQYSFLALDKKTKALIGSHTIHSDVSHSLELKFSNKKF